MPPLPSVPKVIKLDLVWKVGEDLTALVRQFWQYTGTAPSTANLTSMLDSISSSSTTELAPLYNSGNELTQLEAVDLSSPTSAQAIVAAAVTGTRSGSSLSADACMVVGNVINRRYRGGHSRSYWPFGTVTDLASAQSWSTGFTGPVLTNLNAWGADVAASVWSGGGALDQVNVSFFEGFVAVENPITHRYRNVPTVRATPLVDLVIDIVPRIRIGSQRRRLGKS